MISLRPYQQQLIQQARDAYRAGKRSLLLVMPTGGGKTITAVALCSAALAKGGRVLWVVHRRELVQQAADAVRRAGVEPGIIAPWAAPTDSQIQVASVQTLLARKQRPPADVMVWDEAHHAVAATYSTLAAHYRSSTRIGLTATPERQDGLGLGNVYDALLVACQPRDLISQGHLVPARVLAPFGQTEHLADDPVAIYQRLGQGRLTVVFASSVAHARRLAGAYSAQGIRAACVDGAMADADRLGILQQFAAGDIRVVTNVHVLTEGWDVPACSCAILARGFSAPGAYIQAVGRVMRPAPGKLDALVLDLRGASNLHGLPDEDRTYSLEGRAITTGDETLQITQCKACGAVFRSYEFRSATCPACGAQRPAKQDPQVRRAVMREMSARDAIGDRAAFLARQMRIAQSKGYKPGWAMHRFRIRYGRWPSTAERAGA